MKSLGNNRPKKSEALASACMFGLCALFGAAFSLAPKSVFAASKKAEIVIDAETGEILHEENATETRFPASITKVMTLYMLFEAMENGQINIDDQLIFSKNAASQPPTKLGVKAGNSIDIETAIMALVVKSSNDVAVAIAERLAGSEAEFARQMTSKAKDIGMINTNFANASGLPNNAQYTSAEDLAKLAIAIRRDFPREFHYFATESFEFAGQNLNNHNHLVGKVDGVDGLKTGYINSSGYNLATTSVRDGKVLVTIVMGGKSWRTRDERVTELIEQSYADLGIRSKLASLDSTETAFTQNDDEFYFASMDAKAPKLQSGGFKFAQQNKKPIMASMVVNFEKAPVQESKNSEPLALSKAMASSNQVFDNKPVPVKFEKQESIEVQVAEANTKEMPEFTLRGKIDNSLPNFELPTSNDQTDIDVTKFEVRLASYEPDSEVTAIKVDFDAIEREENYKKAIALKAAKLEKQKQIAAAKALAAEKEKQKLEKQERAAALQAEKERQEQFAQLRGNVTVQVGAFKSKEDANSTVRKLAFAFPTFAKSDISKSTSTNGIWFRVRFSGMAIGAAKKACEAVVRKGGVCQIINK